ncbi:DUF624 domain-containing protein [Paenibacillus sp. GP183]|uniref:YesL family protein n=1 Tax=Paenibacillus sp. GP183 TaxID=1882751 RepID=UPI00089690C7|nr:DUF624 domain-containing protein [Paenibacillus sp. GP183]SEB76808.1 Uncharacterized membrane protein YesL [Paenibacillus sp. GP183]
MEFKGVMGGFYRISEWIMRLSVINLLWIICSIPVFLLGLLSLTSPVEGALLSSLPFLAVLAPFTLFPATAAMFTVARKWVTGDGDVPLLKTFFRGYKENYVQSMIGGLLFVIIFVIIYVNYHFYMGQTGTLRLLSVLFIAFTFIITASMFNFFSIMVHLHMKIFQIIKNSILITIGNPINSVVLIICNGVILYVSLFKFTFLIPFFMGSLMAAFSFWQFHRSFQRLQTKQEQLEEKNRLREEEAEAAKLPDTDEQPKD